MTGLPPHRACTASSWSRTNGAIRQTTTKARENEAAGEALPPLWVCRAEHDWSGDQGATAKRQGLSEQLLDEGIDNYARSERFTAAEKIALRYSELMSVNPDAVDAAFFDELRKHYSEDEIVELGAFIGFNLGYHTFFGTLKFYPLFSPDGRLVSQSKSEKLYGPAPSSLKPEAAE